MHKKHYITCLIIFTVYLSHAQSQLYIGSGHFITTTGTSTVTLHNAKLVNNGSITDGNGTFQFTGAQTTANSTLSGTGTTTLNNLTVNKTSNNVQLDKNMAVSGNINLLSGGLLLNNGSVNLGTTGQIVNETNSNTISGTGGNITATSALNNPNNNNPGNLGVSITSSANLGQTTITRSHNSITSGNQSILRNYTITPTNNTGLNATLQFNYLESELNGNSESELFLWQSTNNGTTWTQVNSTINTTNNSLTYTGINAFGKYTAIKGIPLSTTNFSLSSHLSLYKTTTGLNINTSINIKAINIYNLSGQLIYRANKILQQQYSIPLNATTNKILLVQITFENGQQFVKKIIY